MCTPPVAPFGTRGLRRGGPGSIMKEGNRIAGKKGATAVKQILDRMIDVKKKQRDQQQKPPEYDDEVEVEMEMPRHMPLNTAKSVFDEGLEKRFGGINTQSSVFDRGAVFRTKK